MLVECQHTFKPILISRISLFCDSEADAKDPNGKKERKREGREMKKK